MNLMTPEYEKIVKKLLTGELPKFDPRLRPNKVKGGKTPLKSNAQRKVIKKNG